MSAQDHAMDGHGHGHGHEEEVGPHATLGGYLTGFVLSVFLTAIPFWLVMGKVFDKSSTTAVAILLIGAVQIVVHMIYFLHMNAKSEGGWNMLSLMFTLTLVVITLTGSLWVMFHLNSNMMPQMQRAQSAAESGGTIVPPRTK
ncbi:MAG: cytochrome o ubiquinol oxidase subunit IV [Cupriavidus sp.]|nr:cytochrome o ubiquinol oxidase subunit IV [Cupriavidus sp.]